MDAAFTIERLSPATRDDYLAFFDHERGVAFADNPEWATCYCQFYRLPRALDWKGFGGDQNRTAASASIACGEAEGYLAYAGGAQADPGTPPAAGERTESAHRGPVVGWLHAAPRHKLPHAFERLKVDPPPIDVPAHDAAVIVCFVIAPAWRRRGVASALLDAALADLRARGLAIVDAFPFKAGDSVDPTDHYHGPLALFASRGFAPIGENDDVVVVRKRLAPATADDA